MHPIEQHPAICAIAGYVVLNALVLAMDPPTKPGSYRFLYRFLNGVLFNIEQVAKTHFPQMPLLPEGAQIDAHIDIPAAQTTGEINAGDTGKGNTPSL